MSPQAEARANGASPVTSQTIVLHLERGKPSFRRPLPADAVVSKADEVDREMLHISKDLLDRKALAAITTADNSIRNYLLAYATPCSLLANGMWMIPLGLVDRVAERLEDYVTSRKAAVRALRERYADEKRAARGRLKEHFNDADYPDEDELEAAFEVRVRWLSFDVPAALKAVSGSLYKKVAARVDAEMRVAEQEIRAGLREAFAGIVEALADKLGENEDGRRGALRDASLAKVNDFLDTFAARNLTDDKKLAALVEKARKLVTGKSPGALRDDDAVRSQVKGGVERIKAELSKMEVVAPKSRKLRDAGAV